MINRADWKGDFTYDFNFLTIFAAGHIFQAHAGRCVKIARFHRGNDVGCGKLRRADDGPASARLAVGRRLPV